MALSVSRRVFRALGSYNYSSLSLQSIYLSNALNGHVSGDSLSSVKSSVLGKSSFDVQQRYFTTILTPDSGESAFPSDLMSRKRVLTPPAWKIGLYQDLVIPVTNFHNEDKGFMVLAGDVFDVPIRKDIIHRVVRWQLAKRQQV